VKERRFELKDYATLGLKKVLVTSSLGGRRKVTPSLYYRLYLLCTVFAMIAEIPCMILFPAFKYMQIDSNSLFGEYRNVIACDEIFGSN